MQKLCRRTLAKPQKPEKTYLGITKFQKAMGVNKWFMKGPGVNCENCNILQD